MKKFLDKFNYKNNKYIIFGASSGIGEKISYELDELGATVILVARREEKLKKIVANMKNSANTYISLDLNKVEDISDVFDTCISKYGKLDGCIYCAGVSKQAPHSVASPELMQRVMQLNFFSFYESVRQFAKKKNSNDGSRIIAISSMASVMPSVGQAAYAASKAAMDASIICLSKELSKRRICVNSIRPAAVDTEMFRSSYSEMVYEKEQPLGLLEVGDISAAVVYLLSGYAEKITGQFIEIDAGYRVAHM